MVDFLGRIPKPANAADAARLARFRESLAEAEKQMEYASRMTSARTFAGGTLPPRASGMLISDTPASFPLYFKRMDEAVPGVSTTNPATLYFAFQGDEAFKTCTVR